MKFLKFIWKIEGLKKVIISIFERIIFPLLSPLSSVISETCSASIFLLAKQEVFQDS